MPEPQIAEEEHRMTRTRGALTLVAAVLAALVLMHAVPAAAGTLEKVPADRVCMVNDTRFPTAQIPVPVDGKTYFGCCEMCKGRLATDTVVRTAVDPVSGKQVDKATATIGAFPNGKVLYFENEKNLNAYQAP
jgi:YHS domain-containing protein